MIVLHDDGTRAEVSQPIVVPFEFDYDRAIELLSVPQLDSLVNLVALLVPLSAAEAESDHKARIIVPPDVILLKLDLKK